MTDNFKNNFNDKATSPTNVMVPSIRDTDGTGYDIFSLMLKQRIITVSGQVEGSMAAVIIAQLKWLDSVPDANGKMHSPITLLVNSPGGSVIDGMAIYDVMRSVNSKIVTVGTGMQASMGSIILAGGDERLMHKHSQVLVHQIMGGAAGGTQHTDFLISEGSMSDLHETLKNVYVSQLGLKHAFWDIVGERDTWLTAEQAIKIGYVHDYVATPESKISKYADETVREQPNAVKAFALAQIEKMSAEEVIRHLGSGQANEGEYGKYRPHLVTKLAEFTQFWTNGKLAENGMKVLPAAAAQNVVEIKTAKRVTKNAPRG